MEKSARNFFALTSTQKRQVHLSLCQFALEKWEAFSKIPLSYQDSVVGMDHNVDGSLPRQAFECCKTDKDGAGITKRYLEPITALQDDDLEFPVNIEFAYYSIYNLFCKYVDKKEVDDWLIVNQALSSEDEPAKWEKLLSDAIQQAIG